MLSFDINLCYGRYNPRTRIVDFPTDDKLFCHWLYRRFYIDSKRSRSTTMLQRADKSRKRGFQQLGYWKVTRKLGHVISTVTITYAGVSGTAHTTSSPSFMNGLHHNTIMQNTTSSRGMSSLTRPLPLLVVNQIPSSYIN
jgi:hypothetical protein